MNKLKIIILLIISLTWWIHIKCEAQSQGKVYFSNDLVIKPTDEIDPKTFNPAVLEEMIIDQINDILQKRGFETLTLSNELKEASLLQAEFNAETGNNKAIREHDKKMATTADRLKSIGCSATGTELTAKANLSKGKIPCTYKSVTEEIVLGWFSNSKKSELLESEEYYYAGISVQPDEDLKKVYVSLVLGNYKSFNHGKVYRDNLSVPYSTKSYRLKPYDEAECKKINRFENLYEFYENITIEDNAVYFETNNVKEIKKLLKRKTDGLAIDILQPEQFACSIPNVVDYDQFNRGIMTKRVYANKLFKTNLAETQENKQAFKTQIASLPDNLGNNFEVNLVFIQNKHVCQSIPKNFIIETDGQYKRRVDYLADTVNINSHFDYTPTPDSIELSLRIPFENKKYTYKTSDIEPFIKLLNEPEFVIYDLKITAYSSIEGTDNENRLLQEQRAQSIIKALEDRQNNLMHTEIKTDYNWSDFQKDIKRTSHNIMASMSIEEAQAYIRKYNLKKELEPILTNHRYAQIDMKVTSDISGGNEMPYVIRKFNNAVQDKDLPLALSIEKYIIRNVRAKKYPSNILDKLEIPTEKAFAGLSMNLLWINYITNRIDFDEYGKAIDRLYILDSDNEYIAFNKSFYQLESYEQLADRDKQMLQYNIDNLYYTPLKKETVDALNIKFQFKQIAGSDSSSISPKAKTDCLERIKQIVDIKDETLNNAMHLASLFIEEKDYRFAMNILKPWIKPEPEYEQAVFTYISLCSKFEFTTHSQYFNKAMEYALKINKQRYCNLFNDNGFSLRIFENPTVKSSYCSTCSGEEEVVHDLSGE